MRFKGHTKNLLRSTHKSPTRIGLAGLMAVIAMLTLGSPLLSYGQDDARSATEQGSTVEERATLPVPPTLRRHIMRPNSVTPEISRERIQSALQVTSRPQPRSVNTGSGVVYTCDSSVPAATCTYLNGTVAAYYNNVFTNANASIYIEFGDTGLGESDGFYNLVHYTPYVTALTNNTKKSGAQVQALANINTYATPVYGSQNIMDITVALGSVLGFTGLSGINSAENMQCTPYTSGCYNEVITIANAANQASGGFSFYYDNLGGSESANQYDFYGVVMHETDEVLGTSSCIDTNGASVADGCDNPAPAGSNGVPSAVDLQRFLSPGKLAVDTTPVSTNGQYYSYTGGTYYGAYGYAGSPKVYNTISNGQDFADYVSSSPDCGSNIAVQDAVGCPGEDAGLNVLDDGQSEFLILNTIGFNIPEAAMSSPTPGSGIPGTSQTFSWAAATGASGYYLYVGSTGVGSSNIYASSTELTTTSQAVTGLPTSGTIYVRLWSQVGGFYTFVDYTYTAGATTPAVTLTPTSLTFASTAVGSTTAAQMVTVKNTGTGALTLTSETLTGANASSFVISANTCSTTLAAGVSCAVSVEFKPAAAGALTASLSVADNASGSPQTAGLSGTGTSSGVAAVMSTPAPSSTLSSSSVTFTWTAGTNVSQYLMHVGTTGAGSSNIDNTGSLHTTSTTITGIPATGATLNVRLYSYINSAWQYNDYTYTEASPGPAAMVTPAPSSTLTGSSVTFTWTAGNDVSQYLMHVGTTGAGSSNIDNTGSLHTTSTTITGIPTTGATLNVRLYSLISGAWQYKDYTYTEAAPGPATMVTPAPSSTLSGSSVTFTWTTGNDVSQYLIHVGTTGAGSSNIDNTGSLYTTSTTITGIPTTGGTLNVRLYSLISGAWQYKDYTYTEAAPGPATMVTPAPSSTLSGSSVTFTWTTGNDVSQYLIHVGTTGAGSSNIDNTGSLYTTSTTITGIPTTGGTLNVRLYSLISGAWQYKDYTYTEQ